MATPAPNSPVFVDRSGRRRRVFVITGTLLGAGLLVSLVLLAAGFMTGGVPPIPGWPDVARPDTGRVGVGTATHSPSRTPSGTADIEPAGRSASRSPAPTTVAPPTTAPAVERPGQGDEHRATPGNRKSSRSPGGPK